MSYYVDTSFLVSLYLDMGRQSHQATNFLQKRPMTLPVTPFNGVELRNAIRLCVHFGKCNSTTGQSALEQIDHDMRDGLLFHQSINHTEVYATADQLSDRYPGCRTLDLLHVSSALVLEAKNFLTFDIRQAKLAQQAKLKVHP